MENYLINVEKIIQNKSIESLPFDEDTLRLLLVFQPLSTDFASVRQYYNNQNIIAEVDDTDLSDLATRKYNTVREYVDKRCDELKFDDYSIATFMRKRLILLDLPVKETLQIIEQQLADIEEISLWYAELIVPLMNLEINMNLRAVSQLSEYQIMVLLMKDFNNDTDLLTKNQAFVKTHFDLFTQWFEEYCQKDLLCEDKNSLIQHYEVVLLSIFENDKFMSTIAQSESFDKFISILFGCFYLCPVVNERIFIVMKNILFILSQHVHVEEGGEFNNIEITTLREITTHLSIKSLPYLNKLILSIEKLYQLDISIKGIISMINNYELQLASLNKLIDLNMNDDMIQLYNSIQWIKANTQFMNELAKDETDLIFFNKLIRMKRFKILDKLADKLQVPGINDLILRDFYDNYNQSSNFNLNSHFLQDCLKDLSLLHSVNEIEYNRLSSLLESFKILSHFKLSNTVIKPCDILESSALEIVDRVMELNDDVDLFEIYGMTKNLMLGLNDDLKSEISDKSDPVYLYKHIATTDDRLLVRLVLIELKYSISRERNYQLLINLLSNDKMADLIIENWFIVYQYVNNVQSPDDDTEQDDLKEIERLMKILKITSLFVLLVPIEFNDRITKNFMELIKDLNFKIAYLQRDQSSEGAKPKMDLESRIARAFTSSTKDILKDLLV